MARQEAAVTIDYTGFTCPAPLLGAKRALDELAAGQTLRVISDCTGAHDELLTWCQYSGNSLVAADRQESGAVAYLLKKGGEARPVAQVILDTRGAACPGPVLQARKLIQGMQRGEVLQLVTDCTAAVDEVPLWSRQAAIELLCAREAARGVHEFYLRKG